nr:MAG TPA: hypothetical protein [Caudoviricetes sp.]
MVLSHKLLHTLLSARFYRTIAGFFLAVVKVF